MKCTVADIFNVRYGHSLELNVLEQSSPNKGIAFVSRQTGNNGISAYVKPIDDIEPAQAGNITCALSGNGVLTTCLQETPFYTGFHVAILHPNVPLSRQQILFYCLCIRANRYRYSYGRQANKTLRSLLVPPIEQIPEWVNTANLDQISGAGRLANNVQTPQLSFQDWHEFRYDTLFEIKKGRRLTKDHMTEGTTPFIGSIDSNNGQRQYVSVMPNHKQNTITVNYNGSVAEAFYQSDPFWASDDVNVLYPKFDLNPYIAMFLCSLIKQEKFRYNYGRKWHKARMEESLIKLPVDSKGNPDWKFMEDYIKSLPYSSSL